MPAVEAGEVKVVFGRNDRLVEGLVVRVLELNVLQALVLWHEAIANDLHLWLVWDRLQVWVQDAALSIEGLAVAVACGFGIKALGKLELGLGRDMSLVLEDDYLMSEESISDHIELGIIEVTVWTGILYCDTIIASRHMYISFTYL